MEADLSMDSQSGGKRNSENEEGRPQKQGRNAKGKGEARGSNQEEGEGPVEKCKSRRLKKKQDVFENQEMVTTMAKALSQCQQQIRSFNGVLFDVLVIKSEASVVARMKEQGQQYAKSVKGKKDIGPPHVYVWGGLITGLIEEKEKIGLAHYKELVKHAREFGELMTESKADSWMASEASKLEGIRNDILLYMDARGAARDIDIMIWYLEKIECEIQTKEQLLGWQGILQKSVQRLVDDGALKVCKKAPMLKRPEERKLVRVGARASGA